MKHALAPDRSAPSVQGQDGGARAPFGAPRMDAFSVPWMAVANTRRHAEVTYYETLVSSPDDGDHLSRPAKRRVEGRYSFYHPRLLEFFSGEGPRSVDISVGLP